MMIYEELLGVKSHTNGLIFRCVTSSLIRIGRQKAPYYWPSRLPLRGTKKPRLLGIVNRIPQTGSVKIFVSRIHNFGTVAYAKNLQLIEFGFVVNEIRTRISA